MQKSAPMTVRYGRALQVAGQDLPPPRSIRVPTRHGPVQCEVYLPPAVDLPPVYLHLHGGAFIMRYPQMDDFFARFVAAEAGVAVVSVDYDAAPQVRYPVAQEEAHDVAAYLARRGHEHGLDGRRLAVGGFSAGANLAASACLQARDRGSFTPRFQLLGVPALDLVEDYAEKQPVGSPMLGESIHRLVRATYFEDAERRNEAYASPLRADSVAHLPPTMIVTAELDLLHREGEAYARRLAGAGVPVEHRQVTGADHYFLNPENARVEMGQMARALRQHLSPRSARGCPAVP